MTEVTYGNVTQVMLDLVPECRPIFDLVATEYDQSDTTPTGLDSTFSAYTLFSEVLLYGVLVPALEGDRVTNRDIIERCFSFIESALASPDSDVRDPAAIRLGAKIDRYVDPPELRALAGPHLTRYLRKYRPGALLVMESLEGAGRKPFV